LRPNSFSFEGYSEDVEFDIVFLRHKGSEEQRHKVIRLNVNLNKLDSSIKTYRDLIVWQKAMQFVTNVYSKSASFPQNEQFGLTSQIRRSAVSIPSNIAEGYGRNSTGDYTRFLQIALGSLFEVQTQIEIEIAFNLNYISENDFQILFDLSREIERMLSSLIYKLKK